MTTPLAILAFFAVALGVIGTPVWPWFKAFLNGQAAPFELAAFGEPGLIPLMLTSAAVVFVGLGAGWLLYGNRSPEPEAADVLEKALPLPWKLASNRFYVDELYSVTFIAFYRIWGQVADLMDHYVWGGLVWLISGAFRLWAHGNRFLDENFVNGGFDKGCEELSTSGGLLARMQSGRVQAYLRILALAVAVLTVLLIWSSWA